MMVETPSTFRKAASMSDSKGPHHHHVEFAEHTHDKVIPRMYLFSFCLVTTLFALWGFANDVTNPLVGVFKDLFQISNTQSSLVQTAFYGGYATMALPAALFIRKFTYKLGILIGLALYATGALLVIPACTFANFWFFLAALYVLTFGLAFLETTANPYILAMGSPATATRRLNFAQAFNPMGSLTGMVVASQIVLATLGIQEFREWQGNEITAQHKMEYQQNVEKYKADPQAYTVALDAKEQQTQAMQAKLKTLDKKSDAFAELQGQFKAAVQALKDQQMAVDGKYVPMLPSRVNAQIGGSLEKFKQGELAFVAPVKDAQGQPVLGPDGKVKTETKFDNQDAMLEHDLGIVQIPYVTIGMVVIAVLLIFIISKLPDLSKHDPNESIWIAFFQTFGRLFRNPRYLGGVVAQTFYVGAQIMCWTFIIQYAAINLNMTFAEAQQHNVIAMIIFCSSRFICTYLLKYIKPGALLMVLALGGMTTTAGAIFLSGHAGLYSLIGISACMSLMFPTIYGIALDGLGEDAKLGSAGLIFAIVGGALMPPLQGRIIDLGDGITGMLDLGFMQLSAVSASFGLPFFCFVVIALYGYLANKFYAE